MTTPWTPSPNPGGQHRRLVRTVVQQWIKAQQIQGVDHVYRSEPPETLMAEYATSTKFAAQVIVTVDDTVQAYEVQTGPTDAGGYQATRSVRLLVRHRAFEVSEQDWDDAQDDHDRIVDALEDSLRGQGRDLGRPDVILASAVTPSSAAIVTTMASPVYGNGNRDQWSEIAFNVIQYIQRQP